MYYTKLLLFIVSFTLAACGHSKNSSGTSGGVQPVVQPKDLSTLSMPELLATKYDSAVLTCNLWTRMHGPLVLTDTPDDTVGLDLIKDSTLPKTLKLSAQSDLHSLSVEIKVTDIKILQNAGLSNSYGEAYTFTNSPNVTGEFSGQFRTMYARGSSGGGYDGSLYLSENIVSPVIVSDGGPQNDVPAVDYVECSVVTKVKAPYQDEWKKTADGNPPSCLLSSPTAGCMIQQN